MVVGQHFAVFSIIVGENIEMICLKWLKITHAHRLTLSEQPPPPPPLPGTDAEKKLTVDNLKFLTVLCNALACG